MPGVTGSPDSRAEYRVWVSAASSPRRIHFVGPSGQPVVEHRRVPAGGVRDDERGALQAGIAGITAQRHREAGERLADPGTAAGLAEHGPAVDRVLGPGRPVQVGQQVRGGGGRQQRLVPPGGQLDPPPGPLQPLGQAPVQRGHVHVGEVPGRLARPRRPAQVGRLRVELDLPRRLVMPQPQARRRAQERGGQLVLGEAVQLPRRGRRPRGACRPAARRSLRARRCRSAPADPPSPAARLRRAGRAGRDGTAGRPASSGSISGAASSASDPSAASFSAARTTLSTSSSRTPDRDTTPTAAPAAAPVDGDHGEPARPRHAVRGERVPRPAEVRGGRLVRDDHAVAAGRDGKGLLDDVLRSLAHAASSAVLSIRMPRMSTEGAPWLTGATCPGWPLPQLNAPPST